MLEQPAYTWQDLRMQAKPVLPAGKLSSKVGSGHEETRGLETGQVHKIQCGVEIARLLAP